MSNDINANNTDDATLLSTGILTIPDEGTVNYDESKPEDRSQQPTIAIKYEFFISHASIVSETKESTRAPLKGEEEFVRFLVDKLEKFKPKSTYVDYRDNPNFEFSIFHPALKSSKFGIFVCSPRFKDRYVGNFSPFLTEEVKHFWTIKNTHHQPERLLPIIFGLNLLEYDYGPFSSSDYRIDAEYGKISSVEQMVEKVVSEIINKVGN